VFSATKQNTVDVTCYPSPSPAQRFSIVCDKRMSPVWYFRFQR